MNSERYVHSPSAERTRELGAALGRVARPGDVVALSGELGVGKTCLVQGIARGLDVDPTLPVTSPTFVLVGEYPGRLPLRHADFYRVESYARLGAAGFEDLLDGTGLVVVEWAERFPAALPEDRLEIRISVGEPAGSRRLGLSAAGARSRELARMVFEAWQ